LSPLVPLPLARSCELDPTIARFRSITARREALFADLALATRVAGVPS